ncbi:MAG: DUF427 domain-containing protein [Acidimicrobiia bacterium]
MSAAEPGPVEADVDTWSVPWPARVTGALDGVTVVESSDVVMLHEIGYPSVWYFPAEDVRADLLEPSTTKTSCESRGVASYWNLRIGDKVVPDAVWSYQETAPERDDIKGRFAFYKDRIDSWEEHEA